MEEREKIARARQQVEAITAFYVHFAMFAVVMGILFLMNAFSGSNWWVQWPMFGWGLGLALHGLLVFGHVPRFVKQWQVRKIRELKDSM